MRQLISSLAFTLTMGMFLVTYAGAAEPGGGADAELAKQTQNPVADLISIPIQSNTNFGLEPNYRTQNVLNVQPVIPLNLTDDWNLITRTILPIIKQPDLLTTSDDTWGLGPVLQFPTGTDEVLSSRKWAAGPTGLGLIMKGPWVVGLLASNL